MSSWQTELRCQCCEVALQISRRQRLWHLYICTPHQVTSHVLVWVVVFSTVFFSCIDNIDHNILCQSAAATCTCFVFHSVATQTAHNNFWSQFNSIVSREHKRTNLKLNTCLFSSPLDIRNSFKTLNIESMFSCLVIGNSNYLDIGHRGDEKFPFIRSENLTQFWTIS